MQLDSCLEGVYVRHATLQDSQAILDFISGVMNEFNLPVAEEAILGDIMYTAENDRDNSSFWLALRDREILGSVAIVSNSREACTLKRFYVKANCRGKGLGYSLYVLAEEFARKSGYKEISLLVSRRFRKAISFYLQNGYDLEKEIDNDWQDNVYRKTLA
jgi:GNAT superfamily N-acetyltransferase